MVAPAGFNGMLRIFAEQIDIWLQKWLDKNTVIENSSIQEDFPTVFYFLWFFFTFQQYQCYLMTPKICHLINK